MKKPHSHITHYNTCLKTSPYHVITIISAMSLAMACSPIDHYDDDNANNSHSTNTPLTPETLTLEEPASPPSFTFTIPIRQVVPFNKELEVPIINNKPFEAAGTAEVYITNTQTQQSNIVLNPNSETILRISPKDLNLNTEGDNNYSRSLNITLKLYFVEGGREDAISPKIFFHPTPEGWIFYNSQTLHEQFNSGLLTESAKQLAREGKSLPFPNILYLESEQIEELSIDTEHTEFHTTSPVEKISNSPYDLPETD